MVLQNGMNKILKKIFFLFCKSCFYFIPCKNYYTISVILDNLFFHISIPHLFTFTIDSLVYRERILFYPAFALFFLAHIYFYHVFIILLCKLFFNLHLHIYHAFIFSIMKVHTGFRKKIRSI